MLEELDWEDLNREEVIVQDVESPSGIPGVQAIFLGYDAYVDIGFRQSPG